MEPKPIVELHTFRHPTDEQLQHRYFLATTIICSLSTLNWQHYVVFNIQIDLSMVHNIILLNQIQTEIKLYH